MKHALRIILLAAAGLAAACNPVNAMREQVAWQDFQSSGTAKLDNSLASLAVSVNGGFTPGDGPDAPSGAILVQIQGFGRGLSQRLPAEFPDPLDKYHVAVVAPGHGVPLLRMYLADGRGQCDEQHQDCHAQVRIDGTLVGADGKRAWWFTYWVDAGDSSERAYRDIGQHIVDAMAKDQAVTPD
jgi:hypothetical protein